MSETWRYLGSELRRDGWVAILTDPFTGQAIWNADSLKLAISNRDRYGDPNGALPVLREALADLTRTTEQGGL